MLTFVAYVREEQYSVLFIILETFIKHPRPNSCRVFQCACVQIKGLTSLLDLVIDVTLWLDNHCWGAGLGKWTISWEQIIEYTNFSRQTMRFSVSGCNQCVWFLDIRPQSRLENQAVSQTECVITTFSISSPAQPDHLMTVRKWNLSSQRLSFSLVPQPTGLTALKKTECACRTLTIIVEKIVDRPSDCWILL